jgi:flavin-dependent dehydrogenase
LGGPDVLIVGAGPAGACAGLVLARAGARVRILDRARFPRNKLCGDTVNPGTLTRLRALGVAADVEARGLRVDGMLLTGERGVGVEGRYPDGVWGRAILRRDLDWLLLQQAVAAGCQIDDGVAVRRAVVDETASVPRVFGVTVAAAGREVGLSAPVVIAADGRRSTVAFGLGIAHHPARPRRWAIGAYFENFAPAPGSGRTGARHPAGLLAPTMGEMHVRRGRYIGIAPVPDALTNVCVVRPSGPADAEVADAAALLMRELARDPVLRERAAGARLASPPVVLGPLAIDAIPAAIDGLLVAGDAGGFVDPMTGDGLRFAVRGGELAAGAALDVLAHGWSGVHARLAATRAREFAAKWRFNRALRALVASPRAVDAATLGARVAPWMFRALIAHAGDCDAAGDRAAARCGQPVARGR